MTVLEKVTERAAPSELADVEELAELFENWPLTLQEKLINPGVWMRRQELSYLLANYEIFKFTQNVKGSIFYFGVFHGAGLMTFANLSAALEPFNHTREIVGFDTFQGYPEISSSDQSHGKSFRTLVPGGFTSNSREHLERLFSLYDRNRPLGHIQKTKLIEGDVCQTLPEYLSQNEHTLVSLAVLTMNLYEPTRDVLNRLWPRMPKGAVVVIHSLNEDYYPGATKAALESLGSEVSIQTFPFAPNLAYIVKGRP